MVLHVLNMFSCFSENSESKRYICEGDVCVLRTRRQLGAGGRRLKKRHSLGIVSFARLSRRR
ncbi:hypothetical protein RchiOBHm_Chr5g0040311 [Rosa chinensis]|uniref:Uncharacterized protein n=1 Tax=Rosa chinensis TaxID=74649 RepID=A0A2P6QCJ1_ROSCH|nr:hypothetical protein RchiOBHm_Chr5g0040311 [Rosa chinensis]